MSIKSSMGQRTRNTIRNILYGFLNKAISIVFPFILRTLLLERIGTDYVGIESLCKSILQILNVTELGFSSAIIFSLYNPVAKGNDNEVREQLVLYKTIYLFVGLIILCTGFFILPFISLFINGDIPEEINVYIIFALFLLDTVVGYLFWGYRRVILTVYQRNDIINKVETCITIIKCSIQIIILLWATNVYVYTITLPCFTIITNIIINYYTQKYYSNLKNCSGFSLKGIKKIAKQIKGIAIGKASLMCRNTFDSIIISSLFGLTMTAIYSNYYYVFSAISSCLHIILSSMSASVGNSLVTSSVEKNYDDHMKFDFFYEMITSFCTICLVSLYQPLMTLWVGNKNVLPLSSMLLFCIYFYVDNLSQIRSVYSEALGMWWLFRHFTIAEMVSNLVLNWILGNIFGINGILVATIITAFFSSFIGITYITFKEYFKQSSKEYFFQNFLYMIVTGMGALLIYLICNRITVLNMSTFLIRTIVCGVLAIIYLVSIYMIYPKTRRYIIRFTKRS